MIRQPDQLGLGVLGAAVPAPDRLRSVAAMALGEPSVCVLGAEARPAGYAFTSIATGGLFHVDGTADTPRGPRAWSAFVKVLQHPRHWPLIGVLPPETAAELLELFPWREELQVREQVLPVLPPGLRVPELYCVADLGEDRLAVWMEDIDVDHEPWDTATYRRAARLLARLAARRRPGDPAGACDLPPGLAVRKVVESRAPQLAGLLGDDSLWQRPLVADVVDPDYRRDLRLALDRLPAVLSEMAALPSSLPHGDAAPVNLLRPRGEPDTFVLIDWGFGCQLPLGFDIGQLLVGEVERGAMSPERLPGLHDLLVTAYVDGLADEGLHVDAATVRRGSISSLGPRTLVGAFPMELPDGTGTEEELALLRRRAGLGRFVADLVLE
jgi:hypothetical protein